MKEPTKRMVLEPLARPVHPVSLLGLSPQQRATIRRILDTRFVCHWHRTFVQPNADRLIFVLSGEKYGAAVEGRAFCGLNYLRYKLITLLQRFREQSPSQAACLEILALDEQVQKLRTFLAAANGGLVGRFAAKGNRTELVETEDRFQEGQIGLLSAIDQFNPYRGFRFSTYATACIFKAVTRRGKKNYKHAVTNQLIVGGKAEPEVPRSDFSPQDLEDVLALLKSRRVRLSVQQRTVLRARFGLGQEPQTLDELAKSYHLSRERVRQIEAEALRKLRTAWIGPERTRRV